MSVGKVKEQVLDCEIFINQWKVDFKDNTETSKEEQGQYRG